MNIEQATQSYEDWMRRRTSVVEKHLRDKHARMKNDPFQFLRGTYYRWAQLWPELCSECLSAPPVLSIGDLHIDSFGTWRDAEGRLCWGIDDFDEACALPYTNDLVRLAASVKVARKLNFLNVKMKLACEAILSGYQRTLQKGGCPIVLAEEERHLEKLGIAVLKTPKRFWKKLNEHPSANRALPRDARQALERSLPEADLKYRAIQREAGLGSLGQQRFVAIAEYRGGYIAREAKRVVPSAAVWLSGQNARGQAYYEKALRSALRSRDPYQRIWQSWLIRRLSPDSNPIYIEKLSGKRDEEVLLHAMGTEAANVHLGEARKANRTLQDLQSRESDWLRVAAKRMAKAVWCEWEEYRNQR